ncbi:hypothetical protein L0337_41200 [candidate division KSB1 bacterium]|nr:hypothetical protein [candidate division KSB1 bacterium]
MSNLTAVEPIEPGLIAQEQETPASVSKKTDGKTAASTAKPKAAKPKPVSKPANNTGPIYLLLFSNGKYKELRESELNTEAAGVLKDQTLRLVKGQFLVPQISFKVTDEE